MSLEVIYDSFFKKIILYLGWWLHRNVYNDGWTMAVEPQKMKLRTLIIATQRSKDGGERKASL